MHLALTALLALAPARAADGEAWWCPDRPVGMDGPPIYVPVCCWPWDAHPDCEFIMTPEERLLMSVWRQWPLAALAALTFVAFVIVARQGRSPERD